MTREELIAALEKAEGPNRELDAKIAACLLLPPATILGNGYWGTKPWMADVFTASIDAASMLVPPYVVYRVGNGELSSGQLYPGWASVDCITAQGATPAIALCIAALKARA